ncbi:MAG: type II toxin-antitoxin system MqsA family antitoxin [Ignavibacteriae bacterium]|nr:type II toxin-antitoxin system MqsA family antitoxin [Ignavibacteriota bacterium]
MNNRCPLCGGTKEKGNTTFTVDYTTGVIVVRNVPALVCSQCGEEWIDNNTSTQLEEITRDARTAMKQVEVLDFTAVAVA